MTSPWRNQTFGEGMMIIMNMIWMKIMDRRLISSVSVVDMGESAG
jgi:hypothetical protein